MKDKFGVEYLKLIDAKAGVPVHLDDGFTCIESSTVMLKENGHGIYFECADGHHYIDNQAIDGVYCIGMYPMKTETGQ
jgi:hypothetical protein